jgi:hypothetical protein
MICCRAEIDGPFSVRNLHPGLDGNVEQAALSNTVPNPGPMRNVARTRALIAGRACWARRACRVTGLAPCHALC